MKSVRGSLWASRPTSRDTGGRYPAGAGTSCGHVRGRAVHPQADTPLGNEPQGSVELALRVMAVLRIALPWSNAPATTLSASLIPVSGNGRACSPAAMCSCPVSRRRPTGKTTVFMTTNIESVWMSPSGHRIGGAHPFATQGGVTCWMRLKPQVAHRPFRSAECG